MRLIRYSVVVLTTLLFGLLNIAVHAQDFYVSYDVNEKASRCDTKEFWLAFNSEMNLPDDVMVVTAEWMNSTFINYTEFPGVPGYNSYHGWFIEDGDPNYPYTFHKFLAYYSPGNAMSVFTFWFTLTCDNGDVTISIEQP